MELRRIFGRAFSFGILVGAVVFGAHATQWLGATKLTASSVGRGPIRVHRQRKEGSWESTNWSGYAVTGSNGSVTDVKGSWIVPTATCSDTSIASSGGYASFWIGIDGWSSNTVEQIGTDSDCVSSTGVGKTPTYYAWFEFYPQSGYYIGDPSRNFTGYVVQPGDVMAAEVTIAGGHNFTVTITNTSRGWTFSKTSSVKGAKQSSAEWIAETPCCQKGSAVYPLANFGIADYGSDRTQIASTSFATVHGVTAAIGGFGNNVQDVTMVSEGDPGGSPVNTVMAQPSKISDSGSSFSVTWENAGP